MKLLLLTILLTSQMCITFASFAQIPLRCLKSDASCTTTLARDIAHVLFNQIPEPLNFNILTVKEEGLNIVFRNLNVYGLNTLFVDHFSIDSISNMTRAIFHVDLFANGLYEMNGTMLSKTIYGIGDTHFEHRYVEFEILTQYDIVKGPDGLDYGHANDYQFRYDVKGDCIFKLNNLYNGNKDLSDYTHYLIDQYWKVLTELYGRPYFGAIVDNLFYASKNYLLSVPLDYLVLP